MSVSTKMDEQTNIAILAMAKTKIRLERKKNNMYNSLQQKYVFTKLFCPLYLATPHGVQTHRLTTTVSELWPVKAQYP